MLAACSNQLNKNVPEMIINHSAAFFVWRTALLAPTDVKTNEISLFFRGSHCMASVPLAVNDNTCKWICITVAVFIFEINIQLVFFLVHDMKVQPRLLDIYFYIFIYVKLWLYVNE